MQGAEKGPHRGKANAKPGNGEFMEIKLAIIKDELGLSDKEFKQFEPIYRDYTRNLAANRHRVPKVDMETATKAQINNMLRRQIDNSINTGMVRKVYIQIFERVLTPQQLVKLYRTDNKIARKAREEMRRRRAEEKPAAAPATPETANINAAK